MEGRLPQADAERRAAKSQRAPADARAAQGALRGPHFPVLPAADLELGVIYTYEDEYMGPLLSSLARSGDDLRLRLILVDNASDKGVEQWRDYFPATHVLRNEERLTYAENLNRILSAATADLVLLLNTDMYFEPAEQALSKLVRFMREHPRCGVATCRLYHPDGNYAHPARQFQDWKVVAARRAGLSRFLPGVVERYVYADRDRYDSFPCDWVSGCLMLVRRSAVEQVGGFDCRFGKYFEDVDICQRLAQAGWDVLFHGGTYAFHHEQRASKPLWSRDAVRHMRAYALWLAKRGLRTHHGPSKSPPADEASETPSPGKRSKRGR